MNEQNTVKAILNHPALIDGLFKPVQIAVMQKVAAGQKLNENEKRYLRGNLGRKIAAISELLPDTHQDDDMEIIIRQLGEYYITGFEAMKHNGFGWYYDTKIIQIFNTHLKGRLLSNGKKFIFFRCKSMRDRNFKKDPSSGICYATNEQVLKDAIAFKDGGLQSAWWAMFERYPKIFVRNRTKFKRPNEVTFGDLNGYGV
jgi:hypothetical protein